MQLINTYDGYHPEMEKFLQELQKDFNHLDHIKQKEVTRIIDQLIDYRKQLPPKNKKYVDVTIYNLKQLRFCGLNNKPDAKHNHRQHYVTDHALLRILEKVYGINVTNLKNKAFDKLKETNLTCVIKDNKLVTVLDDGEG